MNHPNGYEIFSVRLMNYWYVVRLCSRLFHPKPFYECAFTYVQLDHWQQVVVKFKTKYDN